MATVTGRDVGTLRNLAVRLARECFFGDDLMASASPSGKGGGGVVLVKLDVVQMNKIEYNIRQRARTTSELEFKAIWTKCLASAGT